MNKNGGPAFPEHMESHDESFDRFIELFNDTSPRNIKIVLNPEDYKTDAFIIICDKRIGIDWAKRQVDWISGEFPFPSLRVLDRKFRKEMGVDLSIQCNKKEGYFVVAWHKDFSEPFTERIRTKNGEELEELRSTEKFVDFDYSEISEFKEWLEYEDEDRLNEINTEAEGKPL